jgi:glycosyltransferase involved in cell wall biosynthesis
MKFAIITHVQHIRKEECYFAYAPYIREMNIWLKHIDQVLIVAPVVNKSISPIHELYVHKKICFKQVEEFDIKTKKNIVHAIFKLPRIVFTIYKAMAEADHIHLRCPGNMGLIGAIVQIFFPNKPKTAKYAGNWDPNAKQPITYKLQRWILSTTFLTKTMQVLVYGQWLYQTKNIKPFFTATYSEKEILTLSENNKEILNKAKNQLNEPLHFIFVGTLSKGKQPLYAIQLIEQLIKLGKNITIDLFGVGVMRN